MASFKIYLLTTILFASEGYSQIAGSRRCGTSMTPTGPIIPMKQFFLPAVIKPIIGAGSQTSPAKPSPPTPPCQPGPVAPNPPCLDLDDQVAYEDLLFSLLGTLFDGNTGTGRKFGRKGDYDGYCDEGDTILPSLYMPPLAPGAGGAGESTYYSPDGVPECTIIIRPKLSDACLE